MWGISIVTGGAVLAFAIVSAVAQSARTSPTESPLSLLDINQRPSADQPTTHADKPALSTPAKPNKTAAAARSRPAPTAITKPAHAAPAWPAAYADAPDPMAAFPLASPATSASAKSRAKPARDALVSNDTRSDRSNEINWLDFGADDRKEAAHLITPGALEHPQRITAAILPAAASPSSVPAMVATPQNDSATGGVSGIAQALGGIFLGGLLAGGVGWFLIGSRRRRDDLRPKATRNRSKDYYWASAYNDQWAWPEAKRAFGGLSE
jgi:hypothetical protein